MENFVALIQEKKKLLIGRRHNRADDFLRWEFFVSAANTQVDSTPKIGTENISEGFTF